MNVKETWISTPQKKNEMGKKSLSKNAFYNVIYKCLNVVFPLITMAYVSRILLPIGVGKVASAQNIVAYFVLIASIRESLFFPFFNHKVICYIQGQSFKLK